MPSIKQTDMVHQRIRLLLELLLVLPVILNSVAIDNPFLIRAQEMISLSTQDSGVVFADVYGAGEVGVVLAHGGRFNKESWRSQALILASAGFRVMAIDFRGYGNSKGPGDSDPLSAPLHYDVRAAVQHLQKSGAKSVSIVGASMGGGAAADAVLQTAPGDVARLVLLSPTLRSSLEQLPGRKLFIMARGDTTASGVPRLVRLREQFDRIPEPKTLLVLEGTAHAQGIFDTEQGPVLMDEILRFLRDE